MNMQLILSVKKLKAISLPSPLILSRTYDRSKGQLNKL